MKGLNWLDLCFAITEDYVPKNVDDYDEDSEIRLKFTGICSHTESITDYFSRRNTDMVGQKRIVHMLLCLSIGYNSVAVYDKAI